MLFEYIIQVSPMKASVEFFFRIFINTLRLVIIGILLVILWLLILLLPSLLGLIFLDFLNFYHGFAIVNLFARELDHTAEPFS